MTVDARLRRAALAHPGAILSFPDQRLEVDRRGLDAAADRIAASLGPGDGEIVGLLAPGCLEFFAAFFGILRSGRAVASLPHPAPMQRKAAWTERLGAILTGGGIRQLMIHPRFRWLTEGALPPDVELLDPTAPSPAAPPATTHGPDALALVQYTSGSTSHPRGVCLSHAQLGAGLSAIIDGLGLGPPDIGGLWLPLHHDMGLIGSLAALCAGIPLHLWKPTTFAVDPGAWLRALAERRCTVTACPGFAYAHLLEAKGEDDGLDLSAVRVALNGAEPIDPSVMTRFMARYAPRGLRPQAMLPVYGLAEATLAVTFSDRAAPPEVAWVDRRALAAGDLVRPLASADPDAVGVVCVGAAVPGHQIRIVDAAGAPVADDRVGEVEARGPATMSGYHRDPEATAGALRAGWLRTGDLGFTRGGRLFVTGRDKELVKVAGRSFYPHDVEAIVAPLSGVRQRRCVAVATVADDGERIALLAEAGATDPEELAALAREIQGRVSEGLGFYRLDVLLLKPRTLLMTSSGKLRRLHMRDQLRAGQLEDRIKLRLSGR